MDVFILWCYPTKLSFHLFNTIKYLLRYIFSYSHICTLKDVRSDVLVENWACAYIAIFTQNVP